MQQHPYMHKLGFLPLISSGFLLSKQNTRYCKVEIIDFINFSLYVFELLARKKFEKEGYFEVCIYYVDLVYLNG